MRFTIVKNSGASQPPQLSYDFSPPGGTIGRSTENNWYLPDDELAIARMQVIVSISVDGECRINNQGTASDVLLNMIPLTPDRQVEVRDGDILNIGHYQIQAIDINKISPQQATTQVANDEHPLIARGTKVPREIWDDLEQIFTPSNTSSPLDYHQDKQNQVQQELNDNNPLVKGHHGKERNPIDPLAKIETTIDLDILQLRATDPIAMFNSDTPFQQEDILNDHTPTALLPRDEQYDVQRNDKQEIDPLALFSEQPTKAVQSAENDDFLNPILDNAVPLGPADNAAIPKSQSISEPVKLEEATIASKHQASSVKLEGKLLAALLDGMGLNDINQLQFNEQHMYQLGLLVNQLAQGIVTLNTLRTELKRKANTAITETLTDANNPFKLLPSGQSVLALMFGGHIPGFMPPEQATRDILIELQAHQLGMIAGIRAIATDILHLFHPELLEQKARENGCLSRLSLSSTKKASMWDYLTQHYQKTVNEFKQDSVLFSTRFLQAYEEEVNRYKNAQS